MKYYQCEPDDLRLELHRRNIPFRGTKDEICEALEADDVVRGADATTVKTRILNPISRTERGQTRTSGIDETTCAHELVGESKQYTYLKT